MGIFLYLQMGKQFNVFPIGQLGESMEGYIYKIADPATFYDDMGRIFFYQFSCKVVYHDVKFKFKFKDQVQEPSSSSMSGVWSLGFSVRCLIFGTWNLVLDIWCLEFGAWNL